MDSVMGGGLERTIDKNNNNSNEFVLNITGIYLSNQRV